ncbi:MAG TPA: hypothetical protein VGD50_01090 [Candidatus Baltobacteraceae bacterium]
MKVAEWSRVSGIALLASLCACGGNGGTSPAPSALNQPSTTNATATLVLEIPLPSAASSPSSSARLPQYVSAATQSVEVTVLTVNGTPPSGLAPTIANMTPTTNGCSIDGAHPGNYTCTIAAIVPAGSDSLKISLFSAAGATGSLLSQQIISATIASGVANSLNAVLDANPGAITVSALPNSGISGNQTSGFTTAGTIAQTLNVSVADVAGDTVGSALPGAPTLSATSSAPDVATVSANTATRTLSVTPGAIYGSTTIAVTANPSTTTSALGTTTRLITITNEPLIATGGCTTTCTATMLAYGGATPAFTTYGTLPAASFGSRVISALGFDGSDTLYSVSETDDASEGFLEFANTSLDQPAPSTAPSPAAALGDANYLNGMTGFDITREGILSVSNALGDFANPNDETFLAYSPNSGHILLAKNFGMNVSAESVAAMPALNGTIQGYAVALFDSGTNAGSAGVVVPGGTGSTCYAASVATVPCGLITLGSTNDVSADGAFDLVWDRADQALIVADYNVTTSTYDLVQLNWTGAGFAAPIVLPRPATADSAVYGSNGPWLSVSRDGHLAAVFETSGANYDVRVYAPGTTSAARSTFADITSLSQTSSVIDDVELLPDNSPLILLGIASNNLCVYNATTLTVSKCTTVADAIDTAVAGQSVHRLTNAHPAGVGRRPFTNIRNR